MQPNKGITQYQQIAMHTISPERMVVMLYEGALRFLERGRHALVENDIESRSVQLNKGRSIIVELRETLDHDVGASFTHELASLYNYVIAEINEAVLTQNPDHIDHAVSVLEPLLEAWRDVSNDAAPMVANLMTTGTETGGTDPATMKAEPKNADQDEKTGEKLSLSIAI